jgi:hypothetical protein
MKSAVWNTEQRNIWSDDAKKQISQTKQNFSRSRFEDDYGAAVERADEILL